ncbi:MAG TPA: flagellar hook-associated protein FlgK [Patescibacteria group bacterium]|nr:flagellar hook-associated protein FlgK [Patescibacteria group bacterium]
MSTLALDAALSGLRAAQRQLDTISNNISNASTTGYTRKILPTETLVVGGVGMGVDIDAIMRSVDKNLIRDMMKQTSVSSASTVASAFLDRIQSFHGATEAEASISAKIGKLGDAFSTLSSDPSSTTQLSNTVTQAQQVAKTFNDFSALLNDMRTETQAKIADGVTKVNAQLKVIASLNVQIQTLTAQGKSSADLEDKRDMAVAQVSQYIEVSTFTDSTNKMTVMTKQGQTLADGTAQQLYFQGGALSATSFYPGGGAEGLHINGANGSEVPQGQIGGSLGALFTLRDETLPTYQAQMDEMAQKLAFRFEQQGLRLFTDADGNVPANTADPAVPGYVGFSGEIRVNASILANPQLLRTGTTNAVIPAGSNEVIRRISEFALGAYQGQTANGTVDISGGDLFTVLGLTQSNRVVGTTGLNSYTPDLDAAPNINAPCSFDLDIGTGTVNIAINPGDTATDLVNNINAALGINAAQLSSGGQLVISGTGDITISDVDIGAGIQDLGLVFTTYPAQNPSMTVQVGSQTPVTVSIAPGDSAADLLLSLNAIPNLTATLGTGGELVLTPTNGGDIKLTNAVGTPVTAMGVTVTNVPHAAFRQSHLGPGGNLSLGLVANASVADFSRAVLTDQAQEAATATDMAAQEDSYLQTLTTRFSDESGVDLDEEVSALIRVQTAYAAAARMISASEQMLDDLMNAI